MARKKGKKKYWIRKKSKYWQKKEEWVLVSKRPVKPKRRKRKILSISKSTARKWKKRLSTI